jgi:hypothetical protein
MKTIVAILLILSILIAGCSDIPAGDPGPTLSTLPPTVGATFVPLARSHTTTIPITSPCKCSSDIYNCDDFGSHESAQDCYNYCLSLGKGDIHRLDRDKNGLACE